MGCHKFDNMSNFVIMIFLAIKSKSSLRFLYTILLLSFEYLFEKYPDFFNQNLPTHGHNPHKNKQKDFFWIIGRKKIFLCLFSCWLRGWPWVSKSCFINLYTFKSLNERDKMWKIFWSLVYSCFKSLVWVC